MSTDDKIEIEDTRMHQHMEEQLVMAPQSESLIYFYNEGIIQLGFIVFFACVFPLAPLFSFFTNLLEIRIKLNRMSSYSRRFVAQGASGIGSWTGVMELISLVSIPINIAILLFTAKGERNEEERAEEGGEKFGATETVQYFLDKNEERTMFEVALIMVLIEHVLLGIKVVIAQLIPDVPADVVVAERRRPQIEEIAEQEINDLKRKKKLKSIGEMIDELAAKSVNDAMKKVEEEE